MKLNKRKILIISAVTIFVIIGIDSIWKKYQWLWWGYGSVYYYEWIMRRDYIEDEDSPYFNKEKSEILKMLPTPEGDVIDTIYLNREYHFASMQQACKDGVFEDTTDTVAVVNMLYWRNLQERKTNLDIVLRKKDDKWVSCFVSHWNPENVIF